MFPHELSYNSINYGRRKIRLSTILLFKNSFHKICCSTSYNLNSNRQKIYMVINIEIGAFQINFVPKTSWHRSIARLAQGRIWFGHKEIVLPDDLRLAFNRIWQRIRRRELLRANYKCEICGSEENLQVHEIWEYDLKNRTQRLIGYRVLCQRCHRVHHSSYLVKKDEIDDLVAYIWRVNNALGEQIGRVIISSRLYKAYETWLDRSNICWKIDISSEPYLGALRFVADILLNFWIYLRKRETLYKFLGIKNNRRENSLEINHLLEKLFESVRSQISLL